MYHFLISLLLICAGFIVGTGFSPDAGDTFFQIPLILISAYAGARMSLYHQRKDEFQKFKVELSRHVSLMTSRPHVEIFTEEKRFKDHNDRLVRQAPLSCAGATQLFQLRIMLRSVSQQLEEAHHDELAEAVREAEDYYYKLVERQIHLERESDLTMKAQQLAADIRACEPSLCALAKPGRLPSSELMDHFYFEVPKSMAKKES